MQSASSSMSTSSDDCERHSTHHLRAVQSDRKSPDDGSDSMCETEKHGHHAVRRDAKLTRELCAEAMGRPRWDGEAPSWRNFLKEWGAYWQLQSTLLGPEAKKWMFIRCLPGRWQEHMRTYITDFQWEYSEIADFLGTQNKLLTPDWKRLEQWRKCMPK